MGANLFWRPIKDNAKDLPDQLRSILRDHWQGGPWQLDNSNEDTRQYFAGLRDGGIDGAQKVLDMLEKYGKIELWLEY